MDQNHCGLKKKAVVHIHNGAGLSHEREWNLSICDIMEDLEGIILREINQPEKDKYPMISLVCGI